MNALIDLHRILADDYFDPVVGNLFRKRKLVGKRAFHLVPCAIRSNKLLATSSRPPASER